VAVSHVEDPEAAETVDVLPAVDVGEDVARVGPLDRRVERAFGGGLAVFEKPRVYVFPEPVDRLAYDPGGIVAIDRGLVD